MNLKGLSSRFGKTILVWDDEVDAIMNTRDLLLRWYIQDKWVASFTMQSVVQALFKKKYKVRHRKTDGKKFYIISYSELI